MNQIPSTPLGPELRQRAEAALRESAAAAPGDPAALSPQATRQMLHELQVHQIELELQNDELRRSQEELTTSRADYFDLYDLAPAGYCTLSAAGLIVQANLTLSNLLGVARSQLLHQPFSRFVAPEDQPTYYQDLRQPLAAGELRGIDLRLSKEDHTIFWGHLAATPAQAHDGAPALRIVLSDITQRKRAEAALADSLAEKTVLLKEVHHRVKNNLQLVASLLSLQAGRVQNREVLDLLTVTQNRVGAMALLHENLYQSANLARLDLAQYLRSLCAHLMGALSPDRSRVRLEHHVRDKVALGLDQAVPCGLVINELVSNALKHAFPGERPGLIRLTFKRASPREVLLTVADDGVGLPASLEPRAVLTLGLKLVFLLTEQLHGTATFVRGAGTAIQILFPNAAEPEQGAAHE